MPQWRFIIVSLALFFANLIAWHFITSSSKPALNHPSQTIVRKNGGNSSNSIDGLFKNLLKCYVDNEKLTQDNVHQTAYKKEIVRRSQLHLQNKFLRNSKFQEESKKIFESWGYKPNSFKDKIVVEVGSGSKLRGTYFKNAKLAVIEPLAETLLQHIAIKKGSKTGKKDVSHMDFYDPQKVWRLFPQPAELRVCPLEGRADLVFSVNFLHDCYEPRRAFANIKRLLKPCSRKESIKDALLIVTVDFYQKNKKNATKYSFSQKYFEDLAKQNKLVIVKKFKQMKAMGQTRGKSKKGFRKGIAWTYVFKRAKCTKNKRSLLSKHLMTRGKINKKEKS